MNDLEIDSDLFLNFLKVLQKSSQKTQTNDNICFESKWEKMCLIFILFFIFLLMGLTLKTGKLVFTIRISRCLPLLITTLKEKK